MIFQAESLRVEQPSILDCIQGESLAVPRGYSAEGCAAP